MKYRDENGIFQDLYLPPTGDTLPIGAEVDYDGEEVPYGWEEVEEPKDIYSTDEIKTNKTWIDNKPVYRKVYIFSVTNGLNAEVYSINNVSDIWINFDISFIKSSTRVNTACRADYRNETYSVCSFLDIGDKQIYVLLGSDASLPGTAYITVEYTKTTDEPANQGGNS